MKCLICLYVNICIFMFFLNINSTFLHSNLHLLSVVMKNRRQSQSGNYFIWHRWGRSNRRPLNPVLHVTAFTNHRWHQHMNSHSSPRGRSISICTQSQSQFHSHFLFFSVTIKKRKSRKINKSKLKSKQILRSFQGQNTCTPTHTQTKHLRNNTTYMEIISNAKKGEIYRIVSPHNKTTQQGSF